MAELLLPAEAAERLGVRTLVVIEAMYERRVPLGIPADSLYLIRASAG